MFAEKLVEISKKVRAEKLKKALGRLNDYLNERAHMGMYHAFYTPLNEVEEALLLAIAGDLEKRGFSTTIDPYQNPEIKRKIKITWL